MHLDASANVMMIEDTSLPNQRSCRAIERMRPQMSVNIQSRPHLLRPMYGWALFVRSLEGLRSRLGQHGRRMAHGCAHY